MKALVAGHAWYSGHEILPSELLSPLCMQIRAGFDSNTLGSNIAPVQAHMDRHEPLLGRE